MIRSDIMRILLTLAIAGSVGTASAAPPRERAAVVAIDAGTDVPAHVRDKAVPPIEEGLAAAGYDVVPGAQVTPRLTGPLAACREGACVRDVGHALGVAAVVYASITRKGESTIIVMRLYDGTSGERFAEIHEVCDLCGEAELVERLGVAASALRVKAAEARERAAQRPAPVAKVKRRTHGSVVPGVVTGVLGLGAVAAGVYLVGIDGNGTCHAGDTPVYPDPGAVIRYPDPGDHAVFVCRDIYKTKTPGLVAAGVGLAAAVAGVALVVRARSGKTIEVAPEPTGASVKVSVPW